MQIPIRAAIELTNACNAKCSFCVYRLNTDKKEIMNFETFKKVVHQIVDANVKELKFTPVIGDPLVDPEFITKVNYAKSLRHFSTIYTFTNLIGFKPAMADAFVTCGLTHLSVSTCLQGKDDYRRIYGVDAFDHVMRNLDALFEANKRNGNPMTIALTLRHDKEYDLTNNTYYQRYKSIATVIEVGKSYDNWAGKITLADLPKGMTFHKQKEKTLPCSVLYSGLIISHKGDAGSCWCRDPHYELKVGNIHEQTLSEIWNGEKLKTLRSQWLQGTIPDLCRRCMAYSSPLDHATMRRYIIQHMFRYPFLFFNVAYRILQTKMFG